MKILKPNLVIGEVWKCRDPIAGAGLRYWKWVGSKKNSAGKLGIRLNKANLMKGSTDLTISWHKVLIIMLKHDVECTFFKRGKRRS